MGRVSGDPYGAFGLGLWEADVHEHEGRPI
jgi:hypothetical protein